MKVNLKILGFFFLFILSLVSLLFTPLSAKAFDPNNLIDDAVFDNLNSQNGSSSGQIDTWLNQFPGSCISQNNGFVTQDPQGWSSTSGSYVFGSNVSAGQAIYDTAQIYHVNPQVLLTTLQKEQTIVTGAAGCYPNTPDPATGTSMTDACGPGTRTCTIACPYAGGCMNIAMSNGCPSYCDVKYEGFSMQLITAAWLLRFTEQRSEGTLTGYAGYDPGDENYCYSGWMTSGTHERSASSSICNGAPGNTPIYYDGTYTTSDGTSVTLANGATASLYNYTPFVSGNQSFDTIFENWFGSLYQVYSWSIIAQAAYADSSKQKVVDLGKLGPGQRYYLTLTLQNTGNVTWQQGGANPLNLGTASPRDRSSPFCDPTWLSCNRPTTLHEYSVAPGQIGSFEFWVTTPATPGSYSEIFAPVLEGLTWMDSHTASYPMIVNPASYTYAPKGQTFYTDDSKHITVSPSSMAAGQRYYVSYILQNTGNITWQRLGTNPTVLGTDNARDRSSPFCDPTWLGCNRPAPLHEYSVMPGQTGSFEFWITTPTTGNYSEQYTPLMEGLTWMSGNTLSTAYSIGPAYYSYSIISQYAYTDSTMQTPVNLGQLSANSRYYLGVVVKNTGNANWQRLATKHAVLGTASSEDRTSSFCDSSWLACNRPALLNEYYVAPGQIGSFSFWITTPATPGSYSEIFAPLVENVAWMDSHTIAFPMIVH